MSVIKKLFISELLWFVCLMIYVRAGSKCTLNNGRCTYRVQLLDTCEQPPSSYDQIGSNEENSRIAELEKKFSDAQTHYSKKISELEVQISELTDLLFPNADANAYWGSTSYDRTENEIDKDELKIPRNLARRPENTLLHQVHDQFSVLRDELAAAKRRLADMEQQLQESRSEAERTRQSLADTSDKLGTAEVRLIHVENEKQNLQLFLDQKLLEKEEILERVDACADDVITKNAELKSQHEENSRLQAELSRCRSNAQSATRSRDLLVHEHHTLRSKHHNLTAKHSDVLAQLQECNDRAVMAVRHARIVAAAREEAWRRHVKTASYCGFEDPNLCGFKNEGYYDDLDWKQWSGDTPYSNTGPSYDHTCGNERGQYVYVSSTITARDEKARLISPKHRGSGEQCIEFYYFMYGTNVGILNVYFLVEGRNEVQDLPPPVWRAFGNQGNMWTMARLSAPVDVVRDGYQVVFEVRTEAGYEGDVALDDVRVFDGPCYGARTLEQVNTANHNSRLDQINRIWS